MKKTKLNLLADYERAKSKVDKLTTDDENCKMWLEEEDKVRNELVKLIQIENENKREIIRAIIEFTTFSVSFAGGVWAFLASLEFDRDSTLTSTNGKNIVTNFVSKTLRFKR